MKNVFSCLVILFLVTVFTKTASAQYTPYWTSSTSVQADYVSTITGCSQWVTVEHNQWDLRTMPASYDATPYYAAWLHNPSDASTTHDCESFVRGAGAWYNGGSGTWTNASTPWGISQGVVSWGVNTAPTTTDCFEKIEAIWVYVPGSGKGPNSNGYIPFILGTANHDYDNGGPDEAMTNTDLPPWDLTDIDFDGNTVTVSIH
ncbi:MAG: hypothetical protein WC760_07165 [Bacteroidia bacterium]|jgi:hypothetical protein